MAFDRHCWLALCAAALIFAVAPARSASIPESAAPIRLPLNEWTGQRITAHIYGALLRRMGYTVELVEAGAEAQYHELSRGELGANPENWDNVVGDLYQRVLDGGFVEVVGPLGLYPREGWVYPAYMRARCPGLPDWQAMYGCAPAFATPGTEPRGRVLVYPAEWGSWSVDFLGAVNLPFTAVPGTDDAAMVAELQAAIAARRPIMAMFWEPHWIHALHDLEWVVLPPERPDCDRIPALGPNSQTVGDCGPPRTAVNKIAWRGMRDRWPAAYRLLEAFRLDNAEQNAMMLEIDVQGREIEAVALRWLAANSERWQVWVAEARGGADR